MRFTGQIVRCCDCVKQATERNTLDIYTDGKGKYAYCDVCDRTWHEVKGTWKVVVKLSG